MHWTPQYAKKTQIALIVSNVSITSIDGKNVTSSENLLGGVILTVHSLRERQMLDLGAGGVKSTTINLAFAEFAKEQTGSLGMRIMCPKGATCLPVDCCFNELAL